MGIGHSKELQEEEKEFAEVESRTKFDMNEIVEWYHRFYMDFPDGTIDLEQFKNIYGQLYPEGDSSKFAEFIFKAYDKDGNGFVDFREFMSTLSVSAKGSIDEKLEWSFKLYDKDNDGAITRDEATEIIAAVYKMRGENSAKEKALLTVHELFQVLDKNKDNLLSVAEFTDGAKSCDAVMTLFQLTNVKTAIYRMHGENGSGIKALLTTKQLFAKLDTDNSNTLSLQEFIHGAKTIKPVMELLQLCNRSLRDE